MIRIKTIYGTLDLSSKVKLTIEENSPFIDKEFRRGMFSLPFEVDGTDNNLRILKSYSLEEESNDKIPSSLYSDDVFISNGFIYINSTPRNYRTNSIKYKLTFSNELGFFSKKIQELKIKDCYKYYEAIAAGVTPFECGVSTTYTMLPTTTLVNDTYDTPNDDYCFPCVLFKVGDDPITRSRFKIANYNELVPVTFLAPSLSDPLRLAFAIGNGPAGLPVGVPYGKNKLDESDYYGDEHNIMGTYVIPFFYYHKVLKACFTKVGYDVYFNFKTADVKTFFEKMLVLNNYNILNPIFENTVVSSTDVNTKIYEDATEINSDNHLPDMSVGEFINDFMVKFGTYPKFDGNKITFDIVEIDKNFQKLPGVMPEIEIISNKKENFSLKYPFPEESNPDNIPDYVFTNHEYAEKKEIISPMVPPLVLKGTEFRDDWILFGTRHVHGNPGIGAPWYYTPFMLYEFNGYFESDISHPKGCKIISISGATTDSWYIDDNSVDCPKGVLFSNYFEIDIPGLPLPVAFKQLTGHFADKSTGLSLEWTNDDEKGLVDQNYQSSKVLFTSGRKIAIKVDSNYIDLMKFDWEKQNIIGGQRFVTAKRKYILPLSSNKEVIYELYQS